MPARKKLIASGQEKVLRRLGRKVADIEVLADADPYLKDHIRSVPMSVMRLPSGDERSRPLTKTLVEAWLREAQNKGKCSASINPYLASVRWWAGRAIDLAAEMGCYPSN